MDNTRYEIIKILEKIGESRPFELFNQIDETNKGMGFVLAYLHKAQKPVSSIELANALNVSTARMAVLLKKLEGSNLINKTSSEIDARKVDITITDEGVSKIEEAFELLCDHMEKILQVVTVDEMYEFIRISSKIKEAVENM